jgi:hypothetical protein
MLMLSLSEQVRYYALVHNCHIEDSSALQTLPELGTVCKATGKRRNRVFVYDAYLRNCSEGGSRDEGKGFHLQLHTAERCARVDGDWHKAAEDCRYLLRMRVTS